MSLHLLKWFSSFNPLDFSLSCCCRFGTPSLYFSVDSALQFSISPQVHLYGRWLEDFFSIPSAPQVSLFPQLRRWNELNFIVLLPKVDLWWNQGISPLWRRHCGDVSLKTCRSIVCIPFNRQWSFISHLSECCKLFHLLGALVCFSSVTAAT